MLQIRMMPFILCWGTMTYCYRMVQVLTHNVIELDVLDCLLTWYSMIKWIECIENLKEVSDAREKDIGTYA